MKCSHPDCPAEIAPPRRRWCSERCARDAAHQIETDRHQAQRQARALTCPDCGATYRISPHAQRGRLAERCPPCRKERARQMKNDHQRRARLLSGSSRS